MQTFCCVAFSSSSSSSLLRSSYYFVLMIKIMNIKKEQWRQWNAAMPCILIWLFSSKSYYSHTFNNGNDNGSSIIVGDGTISSEHLSWSWTNESIFDPNLANFMCSSVWKENQCSTFQKSYSHTKKRELKTYVAHAHQKLPAFSRNMWLLVNVMK